MAMSKGLRLHYITDVNKPGHYPRGGWWFVIDGIYHIVSGVGHDRRLDAQRELELLQLKRSKWQ
jgi:hypothetical protein